MEVKVLGPGCRNCLTLANLVEEIVGELNIEIAVEKVEDFEEIVSYGVIKTPALVVNGKIKFSGRVPSKSEVKDALVEE